jgi:hypothetical protein
MSAQRHEREAWVRLGLELMDDILNSSETVQAQQMKPYIVPQPANKILWDYDSGWIEISEGQTIILNHNLGGDPGEYLVILSGKSQIGWIHQVNYGSDMDNGEEVGCMWYCLDSMDISVFRCPGDYTGVPLSERWHYVRVRILKNQ